MNAIYDVSASVLPIPDEVLRRDISQEHIATCPHVLTIMHRRHVADMPQVGKKLPFIE